MPEPAARMTALQTGEVDMIYVPHPDGIAELKDKGFKLLQGPRRTSGTCLQPEGQELPGRPRSPGDQHGHRPGRMAKELLKAPRWPPRGAGARRPSYDPNFKDYSYDPAKAKSS